MQETPAGGDPEQEQEQEQEEAEAVERGGDDAVQEKEKGKEKKTEKPLPQPKEPKHARGKHASDLRDMDLERGLKVGKANIPPLASVRTAKFAKKTKKGEPGYSHAYYGTARTRALILKYINPSTEQLTRALTNCRSRPGSQFVNTIIIKL